MFFKNHSDGTAAKSVIDPKVLDSIRDNTATEIDFCYNKTGDDGVIELANALKSNTSVISMNKTLEKTLQTNLSLISMSSPDFSLSSEVQALLGRNLLRTQLLYDCEKLARERITGNYQIRNSNSFKIQIQEKEFKLDTPIVSVRGGGLSKMG